MGIEAKTLHRWYMDILSDFNPGGQQQVHEHDIPIGMGANKNVLEVPIIDTGNIGSDMCIDEKMIGEQFYTILSNRQTGKIAFCAASTKFNHLAQAMKPLLSYFEKIKTITRDLSGSYAKLCKELMPYTKQIADKFHIIRNLIEAQQAVRIRYRQKVLEQRRQAFQEFKNQEKQRMEQNERTGEKFVAGKFIYKEQRLSNGETPAELLSRSHFLLYKFPHQWTNSQLKRSITLFECYPEIEKAYNLSCRFRQWYARGNIGKHRLQIERELFQWYEDIEDADIDEMLNFKSLVESNEDIIIEYFNSGQTNARAENLNAQLNKFIQANQGVRNRDFFFFRIRNYFT
jgi:transposase